MVALVGQSGGGKSSLIKLIQRLYDPASGDIMWDGIDIREAKLQSIRRQIGLVTQETVLFNDRFATTSVTVNRTPRTKILAMQRKRPSRMVLSQSCRMAMKP